MKPNKINKIVKITKIIKPKKKQVSCPHKTSWCYSYDLYGAELNLCQRCEASLRKEVFEQDKIESEVEGYLEEVGLKKKYGRRRTTTASIHRTG